MPTWSSKWMNRHKKIRQVDEQDQTPTGRNISYCKMRYFSNDALDIKDNLANELVGLLWQ